MTKQFMPPISIIIPTLNEAENIPLLFKRIHSALSSAHVPYEILVVDDNSSDDTASLVLAADSKYNARLLLKQGQPGKAFSLLEGFAAAEYELVCMIDADLQYPPEAIVDMYRKMYAMKADIVITERTNNMTGHLRRFVSYMFNLMFTRLLFGIKYDTQSGLKLFKKSILRQLALSPSAWTFDLEFIVKSLEQNYVVVSHAIPFSERNAGVPKIKVLSASIEVARGSLKLWRHTSKRKIKLNYKYLETLQNSALWIVGLVVTTSVLVLTHSATANALNLGDIGSSLNNSLDAVTSPVTNLLGVNTKPAESKQDNNNSSTKNPKSNPVITTGPSGTAGTADSTATPTTSNSDQQTATVSAVTNTPNNSTIAATHSSAATTNISTVPSSKSAVYYPGSSLSASKTTTLLRVARTVIEAAGLLTVIGLLLVATKKIASRSTMRQNNHQQRLLRDQ